MKPQLLNRFGFLALLFLLMLPQRLSAENVEIDGINYSLNEDNTASVIAKSTEYTGEIVIPSAVEYSGSTYSVTTIGSYAFENCSGLTSVTIPNSVTTIETGAFAYCSGLTSITIPNSVTAIYHSAFVYCSSLTAVTIPSSVTYIDCRFGGCDNLEDIVVDGQNPKYTSISGVLFNKEATSLLKYPEGKTGDYIIPNSVTSINAGAFTGCNGLTSVTIPSSVTQIDCSFEGCDNLEDIVVDEKNPKYTSISGVLFNNEATCLLSCPRGKKGDYIIPNSVTSINAGAFYGCRGLTSVTIPNSVTSIGDGAFYGCSGLTSVTIPNSVTSIGKNAFYYCSGLTSVTIPNSVTSIGEGAFYWCSGLTSVTIPNSVTSIGEGAFYWCSGLTSVTIPNSVTSIGENVFQYCWRLTSVTIPNSVTSIGSYAFDGCSGLYSVSIPNSVTSIGDFAFKECTTLAEIVLSSNIASMGTGVFEDCRQIKKIVSLASTPNEGTADIFDNYVYANAGLSVPPGCVAAYKATTPWGLFNNITDDAYPYISQNKASLKKGETLQLTAILTLDSEQAITWDSSDESVAAVTESGLVTAVSEGSALITAKSGDIAIICSIQVNPTKIDEILTNGINFALNDNYTATVIAKLPVYTGEIIIPESVEYSGNTYTVTYIGEDAFSRCDDLRSITIPNSVISIGDRAFLGCWNLQSVTIPNSVISIGEFAFADCRDLTAVTIPSSVTNIGNFAFWICYKLKDILVEIDNLNYTSINGVLFNKDATCLLEYPGGKKGDYTIPNSVTSIGEGAFHCCRNLTSVIIPNSVQSIGYAAFMQCDGLTSVKIPESVTSIGDAAFYLCSNLSSVIIPNSVTAISESIFAGCSALITANIPESVTFIARYAFAGTSLTSVTIPKSVSLIGEGAFISCTSLTTVTIPESVTYIGDEAFNGCSGLKTMRIKGERVIDPQTDNNNCVFYVPASVIEQYRSQFPEKTFEVDMEDVPANFSLAAENFEIGLGDTAMLTLSLGKAEQINGFQTDISLPEGLSIAQNSRGKLNVTLGEGTALKSHSLVAQKVSGNNRYRILVYSTKSETFTSGEGLLNIPIESDDSFAGGEIIIDSTELNFAADYTEKPGEVRIAANLLLYGDANNNGRVAIDDAVAEALYIMENDPLPFSFKKADVNRDGSISIADVMKTVGIALTNSAAAPAGNTVAAASASREGDIPMSLGEVSFTNGKAVLTISLGNVDDITAMQADLTLPEGVSVTDITFSDEQVDRDHFVDYRVLSPTHVRFAVFSLTLDTLEPDARLVDVDLSCTDSFAGGSIAISDIMLTDTKAKSQEYGKIEVTVPNPDIASGIATIGSGDRSGADVYNLQGILLMRDASPADIRTLPAGLYIINGRKELVK